jgi:Domain of unknown function (DUF4337)
MPTWMKRVPMVTGVLAALAGFLTVRSTNMTNLANYNSTQAVLHQAQSSDAWNEYEADSLKRHMDENALRTSNLDAATQQALTNEITGLRKKQDLELPEANSQAQQRDAELFNSKQKLAIKDMLDYAGMAAQVAIALASVAALTKKSAAYHVGVVIGLIAILITGYAMVQPYLAHLLHH